MKRISIKRIRVMENREYRGGSIRSRKVKVIRSTKTEVRGSCSMNGREKNCTRIFGGKPGWKKLLGKTICVWKYDNIKIDLNETLSRCELN